MARRLIAIVVLTQLAGCTLVFPTIGGISASSSNSKARSQNRPEPSSAGANIAIGLLLGVCVDLIVLQLVFRNTFEHHAEG